MLSHSAYSSATLGRRQTMTPQRLSDPTSPQTCHLRLDHGLHDLSASYPYGKKAGLSTSLNYSHRQPQQLDRPAPQSCSGRSFAITRFTTSLLLSITTSSSAISAISATSTSRPLLDRAEYHLVNSDVLLCLLSLILLCLLGRRVVLVFPVCLRDRSLPPQCPTPR
ncbi:hypothetical protein BDZ45DRAFT_255768 [Acephala macrosclerotiorum]|nr:hypothetical protein BDZ45DRAFT_255768 [Acephala macrosclerotiorum]